MPTSCGLYPPLRTDPSSLNWRLPLSHRAICCIIAGKATSGSGAVANVEVDVIAATPNNSVLRAKNTGPSHWPQLRVLLLRSLILATETPKESSSPNLVAKSELLAGYQQWKRLSVSYRRPWKLNTVSCFKLCNPQLCRAKVDLYWWGCYIYGVWKKYLRFVF